MASDILIIDDEADIREQALTRYVLKAEKLSFLAAATQALLARPLGFARAAAAGNRSAEANSGRAS